MAFYSAFHVMCERLVPGRYIITRISYRTSILIIMLRPFQISVVLVSVENILRRQCEQERNMFPETEVLRLQMSHSAGVKFHLAFMDCLRSK